MTEKKTQNPKRDMTENTILKVTTLKSSKNEVQIYDWGLFIMNLKRQQRLFDQITPLQEISTEQTTHRLHKAVQPGAKMENIKLCRRDSQLFPYSVSLK